MSVSGERIKKLRERAGISQLDLSKRIGMNNSVISRIESGKRPVEHNEINLFADFFAVSGDYLLGRTNNPTSDKDIDLEEQAEFEAFVNNPEHGIFFKEYLEAPEKRKEDLLTVWRIIKEAEKDRKPGDHQGE